MNRLRRLHISPALVVAIVALVMASAGTGYAAIAVSGKNVVNGSLTGKDVRDRSLRAKELRPNTLGGGQVRESALDANQLGVVPKAADAGTVDGIDSAAFARGPAEVSFGSGPATIPAAPTTIDTPVGQFTFDCMGGLQGADVRYHNTTASDARVWRFYTLNDGTARTLLNVAGPGDNHGLAFKDADHSVIRVSQGGKVAELSTFSHEDSGNCEFDWELVKLGG